MPFNLSFTHIMVVGIVALVVLGPERLPGVARSAGNLYREWKRISGGLEAEVRGVFSEFTEPFAEHVTGPLNEVRNTFDGAKTDSDSSSNTGQPASNLTPGYGPNQMPHLTPLIPALGPSTGLMSPGPVTNFSLPQLGDAPEPGTFVPFTPPSAGADN